MAGNKKKSKYIWCSLRFAIAGLALYAAFRGEDLDAVGKVLLGLNLWVFAAALGIYVISQLIFVLRWCVLLQVQSIEIKFWPTIKLHFLGLFYNNCLPSCVGGDLIRAWCVAKHTEKKMQAALSVFVDRVVGLLGLFIMAFVGYWFIPSEYRKNLFEFSNKIDFAGYQHECRLIVIGLVAIFAIFIAILLVSGKARQLFRRSFDCLYQRLTEPAKKLAHAIRIYSHKKLALVYALLLTFCCQGLFIIGLWLIGKEIGVIVHVKYYFIFFPVSWMLGALPISLGGSGIVECLIKVMFTQVLLVSGELALALALCQRVLWLIGSLPGVAIHLTGSHLPKKLTLQEIAKVSR